MKLVLTPEVSWVTVVVCTGYPAYFLLRRRFGLDNPAAFGVEVAGIAPVALLLVSSGGPLPEETGARLALLAVGVAGAAAMFAYLAAALGILAIAGLRSSVREREKRARPTW